MKILLTGPPNTGKTTLIKKLISEIDSVFWVAANELIDEEGMRHGFVAENSTGKKVVIADKHALESEIIIGSYKVDLGAIDEIYPIPINEVLDNRPNGLIILDEIGLMQKQSPEFSLMTRHIFDSDVSVLASIRYGDEWTAEYVNRKNVITFVLSEANRTKVEEMLRACLNTRNAYDLLSPRQQEEVCSMAKRYLEDAQDIQFSKLFNNAIPYITNSRVEKENDSKFTVEGQHAVHNVEVKSSTWYCDCDLSNGRGKYKDNQGLCSHIMACQLLSV